MTNSDLQYAYRIANRRYFGNKLPKDLLVKFATINRYKLGSTWMNHSNGWKPYRIHISSKLRFSSSLSLMTLLHEMVHVEFPKPDDHGPWFNKRMKKLAKAGAFEGLW